MPRIAVDDIELYYELHGPADGEVLVLSNGVLMSTASWVYQTAVLAQHVRLLLYDCRGMWQSDHPPGPYSMRQHAADLAALLDALDIGRAHIGGVSYGAEISMVFAHDYRERTQSLILASAVSQIDSLLAGWTGSWLAAAEAHDPELLFRVTYPLNFSEAWIAANQDALTAARQRYEELDLDAFRELLECFSRLDITANLKEITAPTLVVAGEDDLLKPRRYSEIIAHQIRGAELVIVPHAGHAVMWEQPGVFNTLVLGFVARHTGGK
jgi:3-oxoadipate enol-lactonase